MANMFLPPSTNARRHNDYLIDAGTGAPKTVNVAYTEAKHFTAGSGNTVVPINVKISLGMLYNIIFALDKTIMFPEILTLRIVWNGSSKIYYFSDDTYSTAAGANTAGTANVAVSNPNLFLAVEQNPGVIQSIQSQIVGSGMSFDIDYPYVYKNTIGSNGDGKSTENQNIMLRFDRGHGQRLKKMYHCTCVFNSEESKNTAYDNDVNQDLGAGGAVDADQKRKVVSFYTALDGARQEEFDVSVANLEDYMIMKPKLEGSAIMNSNIYQYNWVYANWGQQPPSVE